MKTLVNVPDWLALILVTIASLAVVVGVVFLGKTLNSETISACDRLNGEIIIRGYMCKLPTGEIVDPVLWEEAQ